MYKKYMNVNEMYIACGHDIAFLSKLMAAAVV